MLLLVYIFNFVDRQILAILAAPIQAELQLTDGEMGLLGGVAFALLYSTLAVPLAFLADRTSRSWVITVSLVLVERVHRTVRLRSGILAYISRQARRRYRRGRRRRPILCADRRLFPQQPPRICIVDLFARHSDRFSNRGIGWRLYCQRGRLAHCLFCCRICRSADCTFVQVGSARPAQARDTRSRDQGLAVFRTLSVFSRASLPSGSSRSAQLRRRCSAMESPSGCPAFFNAVSD